MKRAFLLFVAVALAALAGCANPSITNVKTTAIAAKGATPIYVARFEGNPDFVEEATDMFVLQLQTRSGRTIIQGDSSRIEGPDILRGGNIADRAAGISAAKAASAGLLVVGKVSSYSNEMTMNGFVTVRLIDVATGNILATIHRPSGLLVG